LPSRPITFDSGSLVVVPVLAPPQLDHARVGHLAKYGPPFPSELAKNASMCWSLLAHGDPLLEETQAACEKSKKYFIAILTWRTPLVRLGRDGERAAVNCERVLQGVAKVLNSTDSKLNARERRRDQEN
jgi:hypothetical protein